VAEFMVTLPRYVGSAAVNEWNPHGTRVDCEVRQDDRRHQFPLERTVVLRAHLAAWTVFRHHAIGLTVRWLRRDQFIKSIFRASCVREVTPSF
jgi:hypothetical protein